ncbi:hypothetical protein ILUMI_13325 [Ignelater luminosus]|uniref:Sulfotransferase domain-containing protein n=1 Tax=Ignelater luminosus TaxID=2038154 RepID=A0A8K0GBJ0_IGNLU|nr:hypothetical protein ILUMI_13325 [Ignelater luminosus]
MENFKIENVTDEGEVGRILKEEILCELCPRYILVGEDGTCLGEEYTKFAEQIKNLEVRNDDVWVVSYPKTGTTWTQEMVWLIASHLDFDGAKKPLIERFPFLEASSILNSEKFNAILKLEVNKFEDTVKTVRNQKSPRFIKTHLPFSLLPDEIVNRTKTPKMIYVTRNAKDVCVSYCHHGNLCQGWKTNVENFAKVFMADRAMFGSFWKHNLGVWEHRDWPNLLIIKYEDMKTDLPAVIKKVAWFLDKHLSDEDIKALTKHLSFDSMKKNMALNGEIFFDMLRKHNLAPKEGKFLRSGTVGKYKEELSPETVEKLNEWIKQNISGTSFEQYYDYNL